LDESKERSIHSIESLKEKSKINICFKDGSALALVEKLNKEFEIQDGGDKYEWKGK
jgi:exonuclease VII large subunit